MAKGKLISSHAAGGKNTVDVLDKENSSISIVYPDGANEVRGEVYFQFDDDTPIMLGVITDKDGLNITLNLGVDQAPCSMEFTDSGSGTKKKFKFLVKRI